ncbi:MAG: TonB-dependent receptor [Bacteroidota bacterium]|jgi:hypothetical protein
MTIFKMRFLIVLVLFGILSNEVSSQELIQTFRGTVIDKQTQSPLFNAVVVIVDKNLHTSTDEAGKFQLTGLPVGRSKVKVLYSGYNEKNLNIDLTSGKQLVMVIELEESINEMNEIIVSAENDKTKTNNKTTTVSARQFSIEDAQRYAGSRNDPARMAANFAGVSGANDSRNDIIVRGNSPLGVLWRLNGVDIPNPSHFGSLGSTGGPISILNSNALDNSDFLSGAFPAEYGNVTAGVFDLKMRAGNNEKYEFLGQVGFNGFEFGAEGPFSKKNKNASFLFNYRYSTLQIFRYLGVNYGAGAAVPQYQDLTFNAVIPTKKFGKFQIYGLGGLSYVSLLQKDLDKSENLYGYNGQDRWFTSDMGATGISHTYLIDKSSYTKFNIAATYQSNEIKVDKVDTSFNPDKITAFYRNRSSNKKITLNFTYHKKFSSKDNINTGVFAENFNSLLIDSIDRGQGFYTIRDFKGSTQLIQGYFTWQHHFTNDLLVNAGLHAQYLTFNRSWAAEPRLGLKWNFSKKQSISGGFGLHSQMQPLYLYFSTVRFEDGTTIKTNTALNFTRSLQSVIAYDWNFGPNSRIKSEIYYQYLYDVPVKSNSSYFSALNLGADFNSPNVDSLINNGIGKNYGLELTLEKFLSKGYYYLFTASVFESRYRGSDGIWRNTAFNGNYVLNLLGGKEFRIKNGKHVISLDFKITTAGGKRYIPINLQASIITGEEQYQTANAYEPRFSEYFRIDIKPSYRLNLKHSTLEWNVDFQNVTDHKNIFQQTFDVNSGQIKTDYQLGLFIVPQFRILF